MLVEAKRGLEKLTRLPRCLDRQGLVPGGQAAQGVIDLVEAAGMAARRASALCRDQRDVDGAGQPGRDLVLHVEEIGAPLVEALGP